jgi:hypothetical protein
MKEKMEQRLLIYGLGALISTADFCGAFVPFALGKAHAGASFDSFGGQKKGADGGIDGHIYFKPDGRTTEKAIVSVKGGDGKAHAIRATTILRSI